MITISELSKSYGTKKVLKNITIDFHQGKVYGIMGENGAGKTTLFRCIAELEKYNGTIVSDDDIIKNSMGFLQTIPYFFAKITGEEYIRLLCNAREKAFSDMGSKNIFDLPLNQYASTYSTGMKKKLALTALLMQQNKYIILDEPFNGVDIQSNIIIMEIIRKLKSLNKVILISSHIFSTLRDSCDEILLLKNGEFVHKATKKGFDQLEKMVVKSIVDDKLTKLNLK